MIRNKQLITRLALTLCEIALCTPLRVVYDALNAPVYHYGDTVHSQASMLEDVTSRFRGPYANVVQRLLSLSEDPSKAIAPFDVVCENLEQARKELQSWYEEVLCARRDRHPNRQWRKELIKDHEERTLHSTHDFRLARSLKSMKGQSVLQIAKKLVSDLETRHEVSKELIGGASTTCQLPVRASLVTRSREGKEMYVSPESLIGMDPRDGTAEDGNAKLHQRPVDECPPKVGTGELIIMCGCAIKGEVDVGGCCTHSLQMGRGCV